MANKWKSVRLGEVADLTTGYPFKSEMYTSDRAAPMLLRGDNIVQGTLRWEGVKRWPVQATDGLDNYWLRRGDVVLAMDCPWIEAGLKYAAIQDADLPSLLVQRVARLRGTSELSTRFLKYVIGSREFTNYILGIQTGTAVPHISSRQIQDFAFKLPTLTEQHAIAQILGSLDDKIELNRQMNQTLEEMARAIFKSWFVDFDPVHAKARGEQPSGMDVATAALFPDSFDESELGPVPSGWRVGNIGDIAQNIRRGVSPEDVSGETPYIGLEHMPQRNIALSEWGRSDAVTSGKSHFDQGDILFGKLRPYFHKVGVAPIAGICSTDILVIKEKAPKWFGLLLSHLSSTMFVDYTNAMSAGTKMPRTNWSDMARYRIPIPSDNLASFFTEIVKPMVALIQDNIFESHTLADLRDTLLPKLMSGQLRVPEAVELAAEVQP